MFVFKHAETTEYIKKRKILFKRNTNFTGELLHFIHGKLGTRKINCGDKS